MSELLILLHQELLYHRVCDERSGQEATALAQREAPLRYHDVASEMVMEEAAAFAKAQVNELLAHRKEPLPPLIFAWEPQWAIGAPEPASDEYIRYVCSSVRSWLQKRFGKQCKVIYGGSAGPGLLGRLWPDVDGIFLGRFAHQPSALEAIIEEAREIVRQ
ncbi:triose-phosphate isomerase [Salmonella enterica]|nr:hypothetical protein [Salmonella enterica]EIS3720819.1 triose-phosphate isomerase [Salmonella enterica]EJM9092475.1 triose-phosphate isomerase [Salmonella enterica]EMC5207599.1 triose-phosphate isomerase [Salmonella enterica]